MHLSAREGARDLVFNNESWGFREPASPIIITVGCYFRNFKKSEKKPLVFMAGREWADDDNTPTTEKWVGVAVCGTKKPHRNITHKKT